MRKAVVYYQDKKAGILTDGENGYTFAYLPEYLAQKEARAVSLTLPLSETPYTSNDMLPFFDGLIPEGWLLDRIEKNWKIDRRDRMGLLLTCCRDCIGAVSIEPLKKEEEP